MADKILRQNKIPGCERLTRPEEIKALSKYLRNIKETLEENTDLEETTLEVPGKTTGQFHNIQELPQEKESLDPNHTIDSLETERLGLKDNRVLSLSTYKEGLEDKKTPALSGYIEGLEDNRDLKLSNFKDELEDRRETELSDYKDKLEDSRNITLSDYKDIIEKNQDVELSDYRENLENNKDIKLSDYQDKLEKDNQTTELSNFRDDIEDISEPSLSHYKESLEDDRVPKLSDIRKNLDDSRDITLSGYKDTIEDTREQKLSNYRDDIEDIHDVELNNYSEILTDERELELHRTVKELIGESRVISSLPDFKDSILDDRNITLSDYKDTLIDTRDPSLEDTRIDISDTRDPALEDTRIDISDTRDPSLEDTRIDISDTRDPSLEDTRIDISDQRVPKLSDVKLDIQDDRNPELSDIRLDLEDDRENTLSDFLDNLIDDRESELSNTIIERPDNNEEEARVDGVFPNNEWNTDGSPGYYGSFDNVTPKIEGINEVESLYDAVIGLEDSREPELSDYQEELTDDHEPELSDIKIEAKENENPNSLYETLANLSEGDLYNFVLQIYNEREHDSDLEIDSEWKEKISGLISAFLNPDDPNYKEVTKPLSPRNAHRFEDELFRSIRLADGNEEIEGSLSRNSDGMGRIDGNYDFIDGTNTTKSQVKKHTEDDYKDIPISEMPKDSTELMIEYIRYLAEQSVGIVNDRTVRRYLLEEALWTMILTRRATEVTTGLNRDRLPGRQQTYFTALDEIYKLYQNGDLANAAIKMFSKYIREKPNPINRPEVSWYGKPKKTYAFELGNSRYEANKKKGNAGIIGNLWDSILSAGMNLAENFGHELLGVVGYDRSYLFVDNYLTGGGIRTTLSDLCKKNVNLIGSVEDLLDTLKDSPYITTPSKFGTIHEGSYGTQTLDSNSYWEVIIEPLCDSYLNGGYSYLPCFNEINVINFAAHGVRTAYNKWVPISNFELQKAKLTTKSVGLYDGEFSFPVSAELTNEIRFTIIDDQYKSWRNYFQKCMDVAVYNSEPHNSSYYSDESPFVEKYFTMGGVEEITGLVTPVDKSIITVAFYKNITFRIKIYIMTPQYSTIRRFDLLCVLKDFSEEYSGDIDSGGTDLNVTFSIVGENPDGADQEDVGNKYLTNLSNEYYPYNIPPIPPDGPGLGQLNTFD